MRIGLFILIFSLNPIICFTQVDSTYIKQLKQKISIINYTSKRFLIITENIDTKEDLNISYKPNNPATIGLGLSINNSVVSFSYGYGIDFMRDKKKGKTKSLDFQYHHYSRKYAIDVFIQKYESFFKNDDKTKISIVCPDLNAKLYGISGQYIFNYKKYSYKAAFNQSEQQLKSAGSFLAGIQIYSTKISSDTSFTYNNKNVLKNVQFGISGGYAYTWVLNQYWTIASSATIGINLGNETFERIGKDKLEVYPTFFPRFATAYNRDSWTVSLIGMSNVLYPFYKNNDIYILSGYIGISFTKRLDLEIPLLNKLKF